MRSITHSHTTKSFVALAFVFALLVATNVIYAWTGPSAVPPHGNTPTPINVGTSPASFQPIQGALAPDNLIAGGVVHAGVQMEAPKYCDENGRHCFKSSDVAGGSGAVAQTSTVHVKQCPSLNGTCQGLMLATSNYKTCRTDRTCSQSCGNGRNASNCTTSCTPARTYTCTDLGTVMMQAATSQAVQKTFSANQILGAIANTGVNVSKAAVRDVTGNQSAVCSMMFPGSQPAATTDKIFSSPNDNAFLYYSNGTWTRSWANHGAWISSISCIK